MNERQQPTLTEWQLQAYVDERLAGQALEDASAAIDANAALARRVDALRQTNAALRQAYDPILEEPAPASALGALLLARPRAHTRIAAAAAWMALGAALTLTAAHMLRESAPARAALRPLPEEAAYAHTVYVPEVRHAVEVDASDERHLNAWLSKRLTHPVSAPDLRQAGYALVGGRMLPDSGRPAAQFMYESAGGDRLTLFVRNHRQSAAESALRFELTSGVGVVHWTDGPLAYALAGEVDRKELRRIAEAMYDALNP